MASRTNLNKLASQLARCEGLSQSVGGTPQILEVLGLLGERWRNMEVREIVQEVLCIYERAGKRSQHRKVDDA